MKKNKKTKRFGALLLAMAMVLSLSVTAFAASTQVFSGTDGGTIVIHKYDHTGITLTSDYANGRRRREQPLSVRTATERMLRWVS